MFDYNKNKLLVVMSKKDNITVEIDVSQTGLHIEHPTCSKGHSLRCDKVKIHDYPSIKAKAKVKEEEGLIYIDPIYGSFDNIIEGMKIPEGSLVELFCPECGESLTDSTENCQVCSSPMFVFHLPNQSIVEGCLKKGCMFHKLKIVDADQQLTRLFENRMLL